MVKYDTRSLSLTFCALADPTRRAILQQLTLGESSVTALAEPFAISLPAISKHLNVLEQANLISREKQGRTQSCRLTVKPMTVAGNWLAYYRPFWEERLEALAGYLEDSKPQEHQRNRGRKRSVAIAAPPTLPLQYERNQIPPHLLNRVFAALGDPTRRAILNRLSQGEAIVTNLAGPFEISLPAISKHLSVLETAGLLARRKLGRQQYCRLVANPLQAAADWMAVHRQFWEQRFDALADYLKKNEPGATMSQTIRQSVTFKATPHEVYEVLMDSRKHARFTGSKASISRKVGGKFTAYAGYITGTNLELVADRKIVQAWRGSDWPEDHFSRVTFALKKVKGGARLTFTQSGVPDQHHDSIKQGWHDFYWKPMKTWFKRESP